MVKSLKKFYANVCGATAIEYGLIAAGIAVVIIGALAIAGTNLTATWDAIAAALAPGGGGG